MPRYVILKHDWNGVHYDLMLEHDETLTTWRLGSLFRIGTQPAIKLSDHRIAYLVYEGTVSGDRGSVSRVAEGEYTVALISEHRWNVELTGCYQGKVALRFVEDDRWELEWEASI